MHYCVDFFYDVGKTKPWTLEESIKFFICMNISLDIVVYSDQNWAFMVLLPAIWVEPLPGTKLCAIGAKDPPVTPLVSSFCSGPVHALFKSTISMLPALLKIFRKCPC